MRFHFIVWLTVWLLAVNSGGAAQPAPNYDQLVTQARALLKENKLAEAQAKAAEAVKLDPKRYEAHAGFGL